MPNNRGDMKTYSTKQVAEIVGVHRVTLQGWLLDKKIKEPRRLTEGGIDVRVWTERDIERVHKYKEQFYRKGRGRPKPTPDNRPARGKGK